MTKISRFGLMDNLRARPQFRNKKLNNNQPKRNMSILMLIIFFRTSLCQYQIRLDLSILRLLQIKNLNNYNKDP